MVQVSEIAAIALLETLQASAAGVDKGFRLQREENGFSLSIDVSKKADNVIWHNKSMVLIVDRDTEKEIGDALVDIEESPGEACLVLRHGINRHVHNGGINHEHRIRGRSF